MAAPFNITYVLSAQVDPASLARAVGTIRGGLRGTSATIGVNTSAASASVARLNSGLTATTATMRSLQAQNLALNTSLAGTGRVASDGASGLRSFAEQAGLAARRFIGFSLAAGAILGLVRGIREGISAAVEFDLEMNKVAQVTTGTSADIDRLRSVISNLATTLGVSSAELAKIAVTLEQAGITGNKARDAIEALALTDLAPTFKSMEQSTEGVIASFQQFNLQSTELKGTLSSMNSVAAAFAVESSDIITAVQRAGGAFKATAGDTKTGQEALNEFMALFTAVRSTTRESAESISTGLRTVFTRLQRGDTVKALQDLGVNLRYTREEAVALGNVSLQDQFVGAFEAVRRLQEGLQGLRTTDPRYAQVVEQLGGYRQISRVIPLLKEGRVVQDAFNIAQAGQLSLQLAAEKRQETLANKTAKLKQEYLDLFRAIVDSKGFQSLAQSFLSVAAGIGKVLDFARPLLPLLIAIAAVKVGLGIGSIVRGFATAFTAPPGAAIGSRSRAGVLKFATGGYVPGSGNDDTEPALLTPGEFVLNKQAVAKMGVPNLRDLNQGRTRLRVSRYAEGSVDPVGGVTVASDLSGTVGQVSSSLKDLASSIQEAVARLAKSNVTVRPDNTLPAEKLNAVAEAAEKTPPSVRQFIAQSGGGKYEQVLAAGAISKDPAFEKLEGVNKGEVRDTVRGGSSTAVTDGTRHPISIVAGPQAHEREDSVSRTLLHEQGHDLDQAGRLSSGSFISSRPEFQAVEQSARESLLKNPGVQQPERVYGKTREVFAESYARVVKGGEAKASLPPEVQDYFKTLFANIEKQVTEAAGKAAAAQSTGAPATAAKNAVAAKPTVLTPVEQSRQQIQQLYDLDKSNPLGGEPGKARVDSVLKEVESRHTPEELKQLSKEFTGKGGRNVKQSLGNLRTDVTAVSRELEAQEVHPNENGEYVLSKGLKEPVNLSRTNVAPPPPAPEPVVSAAAKQEEVSSRAAVAPTVPAAPAPASAKTTAQSRIEALKAKQAGQVVTAKLPPQPTSLKDQPKPELPKSDDRTQTVKDFRKTDTETAALQAKKAAEERAKFAKAKSAPAGPVEVSADSPEVVEQRKVRDETKRTIYGSKAVRPNRDDDGSPDDEILNSRKAATEAAAEASDVKAIEQEKASRGASEPKTTARPSAGSPLHALNLDSKGKEKFFAALDEAVGTGQKNARTKGIGTPDATYDEHVTNQLASHVATGALKLDDLKVNEKGKLDVQDEATKAQLPLIQNTGRFGVFNYKKAVKTEQGIGTYDAQAKEDVAPPTEQEVAYNDARQKVLAQIGGTVPSVRDYRGNVSALKALGVDKSEIFGGKSKPELAALLNNKIEEQTQAILSPKPPVEPSASIPSPAEVAGASTGSVTRRRRGRPASAAFTNRPDTAVPPGGGIPPEGPPAPPSGGEPEGDGEEFPGANNVRRRRRRGRSLPFNSTSVAGDFSAAGGPVIGRQDREDELRGRTNRVLGSLERQKADIAAGVPQIGLFRDEAPSAGITQVAGEYTVAGLPAIGGRPATEVAGDKAARVKAGLERQRREAGLRPGERAAETARLDSEKSVRVTASLTAQNAAEESRAAAADARAGRKARNVVPAAPPFIEDEAVKTKEYAAVFDKSAPGTSSVVPSVIGREVDVRSAIASTAEDRAAIRKARASEGVGGVTDPLAIKQAAIRAFESGNGGQDVLDEVKGKLSPAQYAQVEAQARKAGFSVAPSSRTTLPANFGGESVSAAQYSKNEDGTITPTGGLLAERTQKIADARIAARGGADNLSDSTKEALRNKAGLEAESKIRGELLSAQKALLQKLYPNISTYERNQKALEDVNRAMAGEAKVVRDHTGKLLGLTQTVDRARAAGIVAPGAAQPGLIGRAVAGVGGVFGGIGAGVSSFSTKFAQSGVGQKLGGLTSSPAGLYAGGALALLGTGLINNLDKSAGEAEKAVGSQTGQSNYISNKGISGGIQGALTIGGAGLAAGAALFGPLGAAVGGLTGAIIGGTHGLFSALRDAENEIRQAKINTALTELSDRLSVFSTGIADISATSGIKGNLDTLRQESRARSLEESKSYYTLDLFNLFSHTDDKKFASSYQTNLRKEVGPLIPQISQGLSRQAETLGKEGPDKNVNFLLDQLRKGGDGVNKEFLALIAEIRKVPVSEVEKQFRETLVKAQAAGKIERTNKAARDSQEQQVNTFSRLASAVDAAADSIRGLQTRASALTDVLDGQVTATRVSARSDALSGFGRIDGSAVKSLDIVAAATGSEGAKLRDAGAATDVVKRALDSIVPTTAASASNDTNLPTRITESLYRNLGFSGRSEAPDAIRAVVDSVNAKLDEAESKGNNGEGGIRDALRVDGSKFIEGLLSEASGPIKEFGEKAATQLEEQANKFVDGLTSLYQRFQQIGQLYDQLAQTRTSNFRQDLQFRADASGRSNQALDFATVAQLEYGNNSRQQRLVGVNGPEAFDPRFIGRELARVRKEIGPAVERQQATFEKSGGKSPEFQAAADAVLRLKTQSSNLQQALKHLADASERNAVIQEKLQRLQQEREGRLGLGERYLSADADERQRIDKGFILAGQAANAGNLDSFGTEDRRLIIDTLKSAGGVTLPGLKGAPRADDLLKNLVSNSAGGIFQLTAGQKAQENALKAEATGRGKTAEEAVAQLITHQEEGSNDFFRNLQEQQTQFFTKLERLLLLTRIEDVKNKISNVSAEKGEFLTKDEKAFNVLSGVGVRSTSQLQALSQKSGDIVALRDAIAADKNRKDVLTAADKDVGKFGLAAVGFERADKFLSDRGVGEEATARITARLDELRRGEYSGRLDEAYDGGGSPAEQSARLDAVNREALKRAILEEKARDEGGNIRAARAKLTGIAGVDANKIVETVSDPAKAEALIKALTVFDTGANKFEDFGKNLAKFDATIGELNKQLAILSGAGVARRASGGSIFQASGTDTVPAMLTPGEFVVNARSAAQNAALLQKINAASGPVYLAGGGFAKRPQQAFDAFGRPVFVDGQPAYEVDGKYLTGNDPKVQDLFAAAEKAEKDNIPGGIGLFRPPVDFDFVAAKQKANEDAQKAEVGRLNSTADFYAQSNPFGRVAQRDAQRDAYNAAKKKGADASGLRRATDRAAGSLVFQAQVRNFNRASALANPVGRARPGEEGQRNVANRVLGVANKSLEERISRDEDVNRYFRTKTRRFASGGHVDGAGIRDTVPSLLTPGEFVLRQSAVARAGVENVQRFNDGGPVQYLSGGGVVNNAGTQTSTGGKPTNPGDSVKAMTDLTKVLSQFIQAVGGYGQASEQMARTFNVFAGSAQALTQALNNMPKTLTVTGQHQVNVVINGAEVMTKLTPEIQTMVTKGVKEQLARIFKDQMPDAGVQLS